MRFSLPAILAAALLTMAGTSFAQSIEIPPNDVEVKLEPCESPRISADNVSGPPNSMGAPKWIEINVTYTMPSKSDTRTRQMEWLDEMNIEARVLFPAEYEGRSVSALLTGKQVFWSVPCDGRKHRASLFIPPMITGRYGKPDAKANKNLTKELPVMVVFRTKNQTIIGGGFFAPKGRKSTEISAAFAEADKTLGILRLPDVILPRELTPWAHLDFDAFDMPKMTSGSK